VSAAVLSLCVTLLAGATAWLIRRAVTRGEVVGRFGVVTRADNPATFWMAVGFNVAALLVFGALALTLAARAISLSPAAERATALYPSRAAAQKASGLVVLRCTVTPAFGVKDCAVASETPPGLGFGAAALQISALQVLPAKDRPRAQPGQRINLPIRFKMPDVRR
jgi:TonB family protein